jgi:hypothetical protein
MTYHWTKNPERTPQTKWSRFVFGPALIVDGVVRTLTLGAFDPGFSQIVAFKHARESLARHRRVPMKPSDDFWDGRWVPK